MAKCVSFLKFSKVKECKSKLLSKGHTIAQENN